MKPALAASTTTTAKIGRRAFLCASSERDLPASFVIPSLFECALCTYSGKAIPCQLKKCMMHILWKSFALFEWTEGAFPEWQRPRKDLTVREFNRFWRTSAPPGEK